MQIESVLQTKNRSEPAKNRFSVALLTCIYMFNFSQSLKMKKVSLSNAY